MNVIIHVVNSALPIFRSEHQLALLAHVLTNAPESFTIPELVRATGASQPTVWREVERLRNAGVITVRDVGRNKVVQANRESPYFRDLFSLTMKLVGPIVAIRTRLESLPGVGEAHVFGSWARRYEGEMGADPADIDVLVVGDADPDSVDDALADLPKVLGRPVNAVVVSREDWRAAPSGFLRQVRRGPLVPVIVSR